MTGKRQPHPRALFLAAAALLIAGCAGWQITWTDGGDFSATSLQSRSIQTANNSTTNLQPGHYLGDLLISGNNVRISGAGTRSTVIDGNVTITGNRAVLRDLTIEGNVTLNANNADLRGVTIHGRVRSAGNNNQW